MMRYISGTIRAVAVFSGLLLMMCECADISRQITALVIGFAMFLTGILPGIIKSARSCSDSKRADTKNITALL